MFKYYVLIADRTQHERRYLVTPWLKSIAHITIWGIIKSAVSTGLVLGVMGWAIWKLFIVKQWVEDVEYEGNVDANEALENLNEDKKEDEKKEQENKEEDAKKDKNGKGKKK